MADEELTIEIPADELETGKPVEGEKPEKKVAEKPKDEGIDELKAQYATIQQRADAERQARERSDAAAEQARQETARTREELAKSREEVVESNASAIDNAISAASTEREAAKREYASAMESGDWVKAADAQDKIAGAAARMVRLEEAKTDIETRKAEPKPEPRQEQRPQVPADPVEAAIAGLSPRSQAWLREHKEFVTDPKKNMKANAAHNMAVSEGHIVDSDSYFDFCERFLGIKEDPEVVDPPKLAPRPKTRTAMPAAPVSRDNSSPTNGSLGGSQVILTPGEQRAATDGSVVWNVTDEKIGAVKDQPVGLREYARRKAAMTREGRYNSSMTDQ